MPPTPTSIYLSVSTNLWKTAFVNLFLLEAALGEKPSKNKNKKSFSLMNHDARSQNYGSCVMGFIWCLILSLKKQNAQQWFTKSSGNKCKIKCLYFLILILRDTQENKHCHGIFRGETIILCIATLTLYKMEKRPCTGTEGC